MNTRTLEREDEEKTLGSASGTEAQRQIRYQISMSRQRQQSGSKRTSEGHGLWLVLGAALRLWQYGRRL